MTTHLTTSEGHPFATDARERGAAGGPLSMLGAVNAVLRNRWRVLGAGIAVAGAVLVATLLQPRQYSSSATFVPQAPQQSVGGLTGVASQFGLTVNDAANTDSPAFYADLLLSRTLLEALADSGYTVRADGRERSGSLADVIGTRAATPSLRRHETLKYLRKRVGTSVTPKTGAVVLSVATPWADLSKQLADRMLALVSEFNRERRQSRTSAERQFTERQFGDARDSLRTAERQLEAFLIRNRQVSGSPTLEFERDRLAREVNVRSQRYLMVSEALQRARIEEIRDTPVITVIDAPEAPPLPDRRYLMLKTAVGFAVGLVVGLVLAIARSVLAATRHSRAGEYEEFRVLQQLTLDELRRPWLLLRIGRG